MPLAITEEHQSLADVARALVESRSGTAGARRILLDAADGCWWDNDALWKEIVATGWLGLHVAEEFGGQGYGRPEMVIVLEQLGRYAVAGPFLPTVVASAVIGELGTEDQCRRWLPQLASGTAVAAIGLDSEVTIADSVVTGGGVPSLGEPGADIVLLPIGDDLLLVEAGEGVTARRIESTDRLLSAVTVLEFDSAPVAAVFPGGARVAASLLRLFAAAEAVGGLAACTEMATGYAAVREQFGRPVGSFQAVKHHCANMRVDSELATAVTWDATRAQGAEADLAANMAAAHALPAYQRVSLQNIQIHGGIGYTWEHDVHLYVRRATVLLVFCGGEDALTETVTRLRLAGARRSPTLELPPESQQYRLAAREFRHRLEGTAPNQRPKLWARSGYLQPHWPKPYGLGADAVEQVVIEEELHGLDRPNLGIGEWVLFTVLQQGTPEQVERLMWPSLEGDLKWCQLFSEPGAGSDAAAVSTKAVRVDGGWSITGQKVWTSDAADCQRGLITVRTDANVPKHKGITTMIVDLTASGVEIRPLKEITGEALFNEVFFNDVFVSDEDVLGVVNGGWSVVIAAVGNERVSIGGNSTTLTAEDMLPLLNRYRDGDCGTARDVGALLVEQYALAALNLRAASRAMLSTGNGVEGNIAKLVSAEHAQRVTKLSLQITGPSVLLGAEQRSVHDYLFSRCLTIGGGTSEVIRNVIAERILGLPRERAAN